MTVKQISEIIEPNEFILVRAPDIEKYYHMRELKFLYPDRKVVSLLHNSEELVINLLNR